MRTHTRKVLLETVATVNGNTTGNLHTDSTNGVYYICADSAATPLVNYLPGFKSGKIRKVTGYAAVAEVTKVHIIGRTAETIVGGTRYAIQIGANLKNQEGAAKGLTTYGYTAPYPTTAPAATALEQVYTALVNKITADTNSNDVTAKLCSKITFEAVSAVTSGIAVGDIIFQGASLGTNETWKGKVAYVDSTWSATTGQVVWVYDEVGTYTVTNSAVLKKGTTTGTAISAAAGAASTRVKGQAFVVIDKAGYFPPNPATRRGETALFLTNGFVSATAEISRSAVYSRGIGSELLKKVPVFAFGTQELVGNGDGSGVGDAEFQIIPTLPVNGSFYKTVYVDVQLDAAAALLTGYTEGETVRFVLFLKQDSITVTGTNNDALLAALVALVS